VTSKPASAAIAASGRASSPAPKMSRRGGGRRTSTNAAWSPISRRPGALRQVAIELRRSRASDQGTAGQHQGLALERTANDGDRGERHAGCGELAHLLAGCIDPAGADALEVHVDGALAAETQTPQRLFVGARVVMQHPAGTAAQHFEGEGADVVLQAPPADAALHRSVFFDEELRAGTAIRRAGNPHHGGQRSAVTGTDQLRESIEDRGGFDPVLHRHLPGAADSNGRALSFPTRWALAPV